LNGRRPKGIAREDVEWAELVVTMGCGDACPVLPGKTYLDWNLPDPAGAPLEEVRPLRDRIERLVDEI
jgi:arsenate reductase (thioredoxin)